MKVTSRFSPGRIVKGISVSYWIYSEASVLSIIRSSSPLFSIVKVKVGKSPWEINPKSHWESERKALGEGMGSTSAIIVTLVLGSWGSLDSI
ncbi:hypothetical protein ES705_49431 [subsurface metagenome]